VRVRHDDLRCATLAIVANSFGLVASAYGQQNDVVVTAERRPRVLAEQGSSVAVADAEELRRIGAHHPVEVLNRLPGLNYHRGSGVENLPAIRSPVLNGGAGAGSFLVLEDGVPVRAPAFANVNQVYETDLEFADRVEVIRGPGASVHGANAVHGVINVITPEAIDGALRLEAEAGSFGRWRASGLTAHAGWLAAFAAEHEDGWRDNAGVGLHKMLVGWEGEAGAWDMRLRASASNLEQETAGFVIGPRAYDNGDLARGNLNPEAYRDSQVIRAWLTASRASGGLDLAITPFARRIESDLLLHFFPSKALEETTQSGGGVQTSLTWSIEPEWRLLAGVDLDRSAMRLRETQDIPTVGSFPQGVHYDYDVDAFSRAIFGQLTWRPLERWSFTAGARAEYIDYAYDNRAADGAFGRFLRVPDRRDDFSVFTFRANAVRRFGDGGSVFVNYATGARAPQATDLYSLQINQSAGQQDVEEIASAEAGVRFPVGDGRLGLVIYEMRKRHGAFRNANGFTVSDTRTDHRGLELEFEVPVWQAMTALGWIGYADHRYAFSSFPDGIVDGARIESAPEWTAAVQLLWRPTDRMELELSWNHVSPYVTESSGQHRYPGHDVFALRGAWDLSSTTEVFAAVRNLTNADYAERADFAFGNERYFPGEDRAFSLGFRLNR